MPAELALSPATTLGTDALRWIASRHRTITIIPGMAVGTAGPWMSTMRITTDQSRRLIRMQPERGRHSIRIQADQVSREFNCTVDARNLLTAIMDCQADAITLSISKWSIMRIAPAGAHAGARAVYLLVTAPAAIAT